MARKKHDVQHTDEDKDLLRQAESRSGKPWRTLLRELLGPLLGHGTVDTWTHEQNQRLRQAFAELDAISPEDVADDGLCPSRDHDNIIYDE